MKKKTASPKAKAKASKKAKALKKAKTPIKAKAGKPAKAKVKKSSSRRPASKVAAVPPKPGVIAPSNGILLGYVDDFFAKIGVIALTLKSSVAVGQKIQVIGHTTNFEQKVDSMQIEHAPVEQAGPKDGIGIKVIARARCGDHVYLLK